MSTAGRYFSSYRGLREYIESGPYAETLSDWALELESKGYAVKTIGAYVRVARHVTWCLEHQKLRRTDLVLGRLIRFVRGFPRSCGCAFPEAPNSNAQPAMKSFALFLQRIGLAPPARVAPFSDELARYDEYLAEVRGAADDTRKLAAKLLRPALVALMPSARFHRSMLTTERINRYILSIAEAGHVPNSRHVANVLRGFCRYLEAIGRPAPAARSGILGPKLRSRQWSTKALTLPQVRLLLRPLRERTRTAARDFAVLLVLASGGLRRSDLTRLDLDDFDARGSTLRIRKSKSRRGRVVPLPRAAADAILDYVRRYRRATRCAALFLAENHPFDKRVTPAGVSAIVRRAFRRAGIRHVSLGSHVLRHSLATNLVARKVSLKGVADLLGHASIDTTTRYVRVDLGRLRSAARPWPARTRMELHHE
ncbi:MAG: tyrosine-type recombinase/integrase [Deltaproteobacteria bacterium]|nr:tyrosine-type recombinase/integrase [Deltaproteobacteria bacterium]